MKQKFYEGIRVQLKGDTEENLKKATGFVPLDRELVVCKPNDKYKYPRFRLGDGKTNVNNLPILNEQPDWNQEDSTQPNFIKNKPENLGKGLTEDEVKEIVTEETKNLSGVKVGGEVVKEFDADTKVNKTDLARNESGVAGIVKLGGVNGTGLKVGSDGILSLTSSTDYVRRNPKGYKVAVLSEDLYGWIARGICDNDVFLSNEEKQNAQNWLGIGNHEKRIENLESATLTYIEDMESAYEKAVPIGAASNAILDSIGGASVESKNLLNPNIFGVPVNDDGSVQIKGTFTSAPGHVSAQISLEPGDYYLSYEATGVFVDWVFVNLPLGGTTGAFTITDEYIDAETGKLNVECTIEFDPFAYDENGAVDGSVKIMLKKGTTAEPFEPYFEGLRHAPATEVKSYGSNRFNPQWLIDYVSEADKGKISFDAINGLKISKYPVVTDITFAKFLELTGLKVGDTFSAKHIVYLDDGSVAPQGVYNITFETGGDGTWLDIFTQYGKTITITEDMLKWQKLKVYVQGASDAPRYIKNIMLVEGDTFADYEPYSAEPIDTYTIPSQIQAIDGYGKEGFVLDFDTKTTTYNDKVTDISAYLNNYTEFKPLKVQGGGRIVFENEHKIAVPSMLTYVRRKE